jgi:hypothetical protein
MSSPRSRILLCTLFLLKAPLWRSGGHRQILALSLIQAELFFLPASVLVLHAVPCNTRSSDRSSREIWHYRVGAEMWLVAMF